MRPFQEAYPHAAANIAMNCKALVARCPLPLQILYPVELTSNFWRQGDCIAPKKKGLSKVKFQALKLQRFAQIHMYALERFNPCRRKNVKMPVVNVPTHGSSIKGRHTLSFAMNAVLPEAVSAVITVVVVGASMVALTRLNKDKLTTAITEKPKCEACNGSGVCPSCDGEGFLLKNLPDDAAATARANAKNAATRYTAGLAKKWSYCTNCSGSRGCTACQGRGWLDMQEQ